MALLMYTAPPASKTERSSEMGRGRPKEIKDALEQATFNDLHSLVKALAFGPSR